MRSVCSQKSIRNVQYGNSVTRTAGCYSLFDSTMEGYARTLVWYKTFPSGLFNCTFLFLSVIAVHPISVHVSGGQGSALGIRVFWSASLVGSPIESRGIR